MVAISVVKLFWSPQTTWMMLLRIEITAQTIVTVGLIKKNITPTMAATTDNTPKMVANGDGRIMNTPFNYKNGKEICCCRKPCRSENTINISETIEVLW